MQTLNVILAYLWLWSRNCYVAHSPIKLIPVSSPVRTLSHWSAGYLSHRSRSACSFILQLSYVTAVPVTGPRDAQWVCLLKLSSVRETTQVKTYFNFWEEHNIYRWMTKQSTLFGWQQFLSFFLFSPLLLFPFTLSRSVFSLFTHSFCAFWKRNLTVVVLSGQKQKEDNSCQYFQE